MSNDLENILRAIASAPAHCDKKTQKEIAIWLKTEKSPEGMQILYESWPEFIEQSPVFHNRVYTEFSTSSRIAYEFGLDGSIGAAAFSIGYFASVYGSRHDIPHGSVGSIEAGEGNLRSTISHLINRASSIGAGLFAIGSQEINLWPNEVAIMRIEEDLSSLLLHVKLTLSPFGSILIIPTGDMNWLTKKISLKRVCQEAGLDLVGMDKFGRIRLEWNPPVPKVQSTPLWSFRCEAGTKNPANRLSFSQLLRNTQAIFPQKIMLASSRSEAARKQNSAIYATPSKKKKSRQSQSTPGKSQSHLPETQASHPISAFVFYQDQAFADLDTE